MDMLQAEGTVIGRFKVRSLMREAGLISKQPGPHRYKQATVERVDIPNQLNREFDVSGPDKVWCGDITYIWAEGRWHYLAVVLDFYRRRVVGRALSTQPNADLVVAALDFHIAILEACHQGWRHIKRGCGIGGHGCFSPLAPLFFSTSLVQDPRLSTEQYKRR